MKRIIITLQILIFGGIQAHLNVPLAAQNQMRILFVVSRFPAHAGTAVLNQITGLIDKGHKIEIWAHTQGRKEWMHPLISTYNLLAKTSFGKIPPPLKNF